MSTLYFTTEFNLWQASCFVSQARIGPKTPSPDTKGQKWNSPLDQNAKIGDNIARHVSGFTTPSWRPPTPSPSALQRAGWYSYDWLHRLMGVAGSVDDDRRSARRIVPQLQHLEVGDSVEIGPGMGFTVVTSEPGRALVLHVALDMRTWRPFDPAGTTPDAYLNVSWVWFLDGVDQRTTRLIVRTRYDYNPSLLNALMIGSLTGPGGSVMERKTLLGIQQRAEAAAG